MCATDLRVFLLYLRLILAHSVPRELEIDAQQLTSGYEYQIGVTATTFLGASSLQVGAVCAVCPCLRCESTRRNDVFLVQTASENTRIRHSNRPYPTPKRAHLTGGYGGYAGRTRAAHLAAPPAPPRDHPSDPPLPPQVATPC